MIIIIHRALNRAKSLQRLLLYTSTVMIGGWVMMMMNYNNTLLRLNKEWKTYCLVVSFYMYVLILLCIHIIILMWKTRLYRYEFWKIANAYTFKSGFKYDILKLFIAAWYHFIIFPFVRELIYNWYDAPVITYQNL